MEHKDLSFTTPEGEKVYGSSRPPEDIKEKLRQQQEREFQLAKELSQGLGSDKSEKAKNKMGGKKDNIIEMPPRKKDVVEKKVGEKIAA